MATPTFPIPPTHDAVRSNRKFRLLMHAYGRSAQQIVSTRLKTGETQVVDSLGSGPERLVTERVGDKRSGDFFYMFSLFGLFNSCLICCKDRSDRSVPVSEYR